MTKNTATTICSIIVAARCATYADDMLEMLISDMREEALDHRSTRLNDLEKGNLLDFADLLEAALIDAVRAHTE